MAGNYPDIYNYRNWNSFRYGGYYFHPEVITQRDYDWLSKFLCNIFEKSHSVEKIANLFNNPVYKASLHQDRWWK